MNIEQLYEELKTALHRVVMENGLAGERLRVRCKALSVKEAIGTPEERDYPIVKGKEVMVEAVFRDGRGQAFADEYENADYSIEELLEIVPDTTRKRASFIAGMNAVYRALGLCDKTVHCRDQEPRECAQALPALFDPSQKILIIGFQPRFVESLAADHHVRVIDLDSDNIGSEKYGVTIEPPGMTSDAIQWCDSIFATGSTIVNGTIGTFLSGGKPATFYGVSISAPAKVLNLKSYCKMGR